MKPKAWIALGLLAILALTPALAEKVKIYTGLPGSDQFHWGTAPTNGPADDWSAFGTMPLSLMDNMVCTDGRYIYVPGGYTGSGSNALNRYDPLQNTWTSLANLPVDVTSTGAAIIGDTLYIAGGYIGMSTALDTLLKYSISTNTWVGAPGNHSGNNWFPELVANKGRLFFIGGNFEGGASAPSQQVWIYTPGVGWSLGDSLNVGRVFTQAVVYHDTIWVAGGTTNAGSIANTEFFDPITNQWVVDAGVFPDMPTGIWGAAQGVAEDRFVIFSGVEPSWAIYGYCQYFNFTTKTWETPEAVSAPRYRTDGCGFMNRAAFAFGGSSGGFTPTPDVQYKNLGPTPDAAVLQLVDPKFPTYPANYDIYGTVRVANLGDAAATIPAHLHVADHGTWSWNGVVNVDLAPFHDTTFTFNHGSIGGVGGQWDFQYTTELPGDANPGNDTLVRFFSVSEWAAMPQNLPYQTAGNYCGYGTGPNGHPTVYLIGGTDVSNYIDSCLGYDLTDNTWINYAHMPGVAGLGATAICEGKIYILGGWTAENNNYIYDMAANTWSTGATIPNGVQSASAAVYKDNLIYLLGGGSGTTAQNYVQVYDIAANTWYQATPLPASRWGGAAACINDRYLIYSNGGTDFGSGYANTWIGEIDPYDPTIIIWKEASPCPAGGSYRVGYATLDDALFITGGMDASGSNPITATLVYNPEFDAWLSLTNKRTPSAHFGCAVGPNGVYTPGGYVGTFLDTFEVYTMMSHQTYVEGGPAQKPLTPKLSLNVHPNPCNSRATVQFQIPKIGEAELAIYNITGQRVRTLLKGRLMAGNHGFVWDGRDGNGKLVASGSYLAVLKTDGQQASQRLVLIK